MARLAGKVALVTGASRNIGRAIALCFAAEGAQLVIGAGSDKGALEETASRCEGADVLPIVADLADPEQAQSMVRQGIERFGRIDVVVAAAAVRPHAPFLEMTIEEWQRVLNVNLNGAFYLCKAVAPGMIERGSGSIVLFGGWNAMNGSHGAPANGAAKMGLLGLVRSMSTALAPHGVRTNMVVPGQIDTKRDGPSSFQNGQADDVPLRRRGLPEEIAKTCLFLASDDASYITGEHIGVTGGRLVP